MATKSYRSTPVFDAETLPQALRREHRTKADAWGIIRILEGTLRLEFADGSPEKLLTPDAPGLILPEQVHWVTPLGAMRMQVDFYAALPDISAVEAVPALDTYFPEEAHRKHHQSELLDEALIETFPASDPVSIVRLD